VIALGLVSLFKDAVGDMINPLLPAFVASVGGGPETLGMIEGLADAVASLLQLASGCSICVTRGGPIWPRKSMTRWY